MSHAPKKPNWPLRGDLAELPLYAVGASGQAGLVTHLALIHPHGSCMDLAGTAWPGMASWRQMRLPWEMLCSFACHQISGRTVF